ncbi:MAG: HDOD domain-containing protein [Pseudomonadales bacterium]|nr:HDOD domain-containing protein [Pseudomonadales bacterium]
MQQSIDTIRNEILNAIKNDELILPTMPEVALKLRDVANDPNVDANRIATVISSDAALTARIIKIANSPLVRGVASVEDLQMAISRMGVTYTSNLAIGIAMEQLFQATSEAVDDRLRRTWEHSTEVAGLSHVLCRHFTNLSPDQATLGGLVHEIGTLPILLWADDHDWDERLIDEVVERLHPEFGKMILEAWDFPEDLYQIPLGYTEFSRIVEETDYVDVVMVANLQTLAGSDHALASMDYSGIQAFENLGIEVDVVLANNDDLREEVTAAVDAFH